jgi:hypothetical protein
MIENPKRIMSGDEIEDHYRDLLKKIGRYLRWSSDAYPSPAQKDLKAIRKIIFEETGLDFEELT